MSLKIKVELFEVKRKFFSLLGDKKNFKLFLIHFYGIFLVVKIYFNTKLWNIHQLCVLHVFIEK